MKMKKILKKVFLQVASYFDILKIVFFGDKLYILVDPNFVSHFDPFDQRQTKS